VRLGDLSLRPEKFAPTGKAERRPSLPIGKDRAWWIDMIERRTAQAVKGILSSKLGPIDALSPANSLVAGCMHAAADWGVDLRPCFKETHASNMSKSPPVRRPDGKILKGPNYKPADVAFYLILQGWRKAA
jgi:hypothetical protein